jgi:hypothetical protein
MPDVDGRQRYVLETAVSDEEIRSFVMIFRRLYMAKEPGNFRNAAAVFIDVLQPHPVATWVGAITAEYDKELQGEPSFIPWNRHGAFSFSGKLLVDVFLNTKYAHQPNDQRTRQYQDCLAYVGGSTDFLTWLFLTQIWKCALYFDGAGATIAAFYDCYCECHKVTGDVLPSVRTDQPGLGTLEKKEAREARIFREKSEELARTIWENEGRPSGGHGQFIDTAAKQLLAATGRNKQGHADGVRSA